MKPSQVPRITVDGAPLRDDLAMLLVDAVVDDDLYLPDLFELRFADPNRTFADDMPFAIGATVEIKTGSLGAEAVTTLINAEVTAIEATLDATGSFLTVTGYDQSHRLHRGVKTATFNDVTDSDVAKRIAQAAGLTIGTVDATTETLEHVSQVNETDWTFLQTRARESGHRVFVKDGAFQFRTSLDGPASAAPELTFGRELVEFSARMTATEQVAQVESRGWDPVNKEVVSERAATKVVSADLPSSTIKASTIDRTFGESVFVSTDRAVATIADARVATAGLALDLSSAQLFATGVAVGDPAIAADARIKIVGTGRAFDGTWTVSHSRHVFGPDGYTVHFTISGCQDRSLGGLIAGMSGGAAPAGAPRQDGVAIGIVTDTADPLEIGRVKVKLPWLHDDYETSWCRVCYPGAGPERGFFVCPEINDEVLVAFDQGDVRHPVVIGSLFNGKDKPDGGSYSAASDGAITRRAWTSRNGHKIVILEDPDSPDGDTINLVTKNGVVMNVRDDGELMVDAKKITFSVKEDIDISAHGDVKIVGRNLTFEARSALDLSATSGAKLDGGAQTEVKGGMVKLN